MNEAERPRIVVSVHRDESAPGSVRGQEWNLEPVQNLATQTAALHVGAHSETANLDRGITPPPLLVRNAPLQPIPRRLGAVHPVR